MQRLIPEKQTGDHHQSEDKRSDIPNDGGRQKDGS